MCKFEEIAEDEDRVAHTGLFLDESYTYKMSNWDNPSKLVDRLILLYNRLIRGNHDVLGRIR